MLIYGEKIVLRVLDRDNSFVELEKLGLDTDDLKLKSRSHPPSLADYFALFFTWDLHFSLFFSTFARILTKVRRKPLSVGFPHKGQTVETWRQPVSLKGQDRRNELNHPI